MKPKHLLIFPLLSVLALGCPSLGPDWEPIDPDENTLGFGWSANSLSNPTEAGRFGVSFGIQSYPEYIHVPPARPIFSGPGTILYPGNREYIPFDELEAYYCNGISGIYRPPPNDEVPQGGIKVIFACEVLSPISNKWERSPDYTMTVLRRNKPMEVYIIPTWQDPKRGLYDGVGGEHLVLVEADVESGEVYELFGFKARPAPAEDRQLKYGLKGPEGYTGDLGNLGKTATWVPGYSQLLAPWETSAWFDYTAPANITSPLDVVAWFSVYDPWMKETQVRELIFHVKPKE